MTPRDVLENRARYCVVTGDLRDVLPTIGRVEHVITDPPYSAHVHSKSRAGTQRLTDGQGEFSRSAMSRTRDFGFEHLSSSLRRFCASEFARLAERWVLCFGDEISANGWRLSLQVAGLEYVRWLTWIKRGCTPQFTGDRPAAACELMVLAHPKGRKRWNSSGKRGVYDHAIELDRYGHGRVERVHPAQKPLSLMLELVEDFTDPDDVVLDPFCGSGTTLVAALRLGRRAIGVELKPEHAASARERCEAEVGSTTAAAMRGGQGSLFAATGGGK